jgi:hypothetical protein
VRQRFTEAVEQWEDALDVPVERAGRYLASRLPEGASDPAETIIYLDRWCTRHLPQDCAAQHTAPHNARYGGVEDRMVSAGLPRHTVLTELVGVVRTGRRLVELGSAATDEDRRAYQARKAAVLRAAETPATPCE